MMLAKGCLGIVQKRVIYECLVQTEQNRPDQTKTPGEVAVGNGGAGWKLFTWVGGRGLRRGPPQDAFSLLLWPGRHSILLSTYQRPLSQGIGTPVSSRADGPPALEAQPIRC